MHGVMGSTLASEEAVCVLRTAVLERKAAELDLLRLIVGNFLAHVSCGDATVSDLESALLESGIDISPERDRRLAQIKAGR